MALTIKLFSLILFICFAIPCFSQVPVIQWQKCYGGGSDEHAYNIEQTTDGGYIIAGQSTSSEGDVTINHGNTDIWVVKINNTGSISWQISLGGSGADVASDVKQTIDGGYIVAGTTSSDDGNVSGNHGGTDVWIIKLSSTGNIEWQKCYGGTGVEVSTAINKTNDGGYIISNYSSSNDGDVSGNHGGSADGWVFKINSLGDITWEKCYGGTGRDNAFSIQQTSDGGYIIAGQTSSNNGDVSGNHGGIDIWIIKTDNNGDIIWQKTLGGSNDDLAFKILPVSNGGYIVAGTTRSNNGDVTGFHGFVDYWLVRLDNMGNITWQKTLGGSNLDNCFTVEQVADGGFIAAGMTTSADGDITSLQGVSDYWVVKVSGAGVLEWQKCYGGNGGEAAQCIKKTSDGGVIIAGVTDSNNNGDVGPNNGATDYWIVKLASGSLPVKLSKLDAKEQAGSVLCTWQTYEEQNSKNFVIERSVDGIHFKDIGIVTAVGNSQVMASYNFTDNKAFETGTEKLYYRLKMADNDESSTYSNIAFVKLKFNSSINIYPNPATNQVNISFTSPSAFNGVVQITDEYGRNVLKQNRMIKKGNNSFTQNIAFLSAGNYILTVNGKSNYICSFIRHTE